MQENRPVALVVRTDNAADPTDDRAVLVRCPPGTTATYDFSTFTQSMIDGLTAYPTGFSEVREADITPDIGIGPGSTGVLTLNRPYDRVPRDTGCSFCTAGVGAVLFKSDGTLALTNNQTSGSVTVSVAASWPTPSASEMYTVSLMSLTGEVRVWH
jgi:hypothetical protein